MTGDLYDKEESRSKNNSDQLLRKQVASGHAINAHNKSKVVWEVINPTWSKKETSVNEIQLQVDSKIVDNSKEVADYLNSYIMHMAKKHKTI